MGRDILPHGSYLVNLANPDGEKRAKAYDCFLDELKRCEQLGIRLHNFQYNLLNYSCADNSPGSASDKQNGIELISECINQAHQETKSVKVVLENSAGGVNSIGTSFEDLRGIIDRVKGMCPW
jgi:AP endonuclease-1